MVVRDAALEDGFRQGSPASRRLLHFGRKIWLICNKLNYVLVDRSVTLFLAPANGLSPLARPPLVLVQFSTAS